jgi:hypothetical protein
MNRSRRIPKRVRGAAFLTGIVVSAFAAAGLAALGHAGGSPPRSAVVDDLRLSYPASFELRRFRSCSYAVTGVRGTCVHGAVVGSYALLRHPELGAKGATFPPTGVAFELVTAGQHPPELIAPVVTFPVSLADFHRVGRGIGGPSRAQRELFFRVDAVNYWAIAWSGPAATRDERARLAEVVRSLRTK